MNTDLSESESHFPKATPHLRTMIRHYEKVLPKKDFEDLIQEMIGMYEVCLAEFKDMPQGPDRARALHKLLEKEIRSANQLKTSCGKGCSACCHLEVEVTTDEGDLLAERIQGGLEIDRARLERLANRERQSKDWAFPPRPENSCVFLGEAGECRVYDDRPSICRKHLVTTPPLECADPKGHPHPILIPIAEIALSAILCLPNNGPKSLPKAVSESLNRPEKTIIDCL